MRIAPKSGEVKREAIGEWQRILFTFDRFYHDYGATAYVDLRLHRFDERTIVFVFMYTDIRSQEGTIKAILESFRWPSKQDGTNETKAKTQGRATGTPATPSAAGVLPFEAARSCPNFERSTQ